MPPRKKKPAAATVGLTALEVPGVDLYTGPTPAEAPADVKALAMQIADDDGAVLAAYRDPFGEKWLVLAALPIERVEPTPFQRELSKTHADRLATVIPKVGQFLDPLIVIRKDDSYWTPNGMHRLAAMKALGAKSIIALCVPDPAIAFRILALNTEKAHNLKDKSLEVWRMAKSLAEDEALSNQPESTWAFEFEEPAYLTIGAAYDERARFSGSVYLPILKRCEAFDDAPIAVSVEARLARRDKLLLLDTAVTEAVARLKEAGLTSPYLKAFVVARINHLRFAKAKPGQVPSTAEFDATLDKMIASAEKLDASKIRPEDVAKASGGGGGDE